MPWLEKDGPYMGNKAQQTMMDGIVKEYPYHGDRTGNIDGWVWEVIDCMSAQMPTWKPDTDMVKSYLSYKIGRLPLTKAEN